MQAKVETKPAKKEKISQQKKPILQMLPENPDKPPEWERKPKHGN